VPLFWLQTEDHDFAEIASVTVATADGSSRRLVLADDPARPGRSSIAHRRLGADVTDLLGVLGETLGEGAAAADTLALLGRHYRPGRPMASAFAGAMAELFADEGLLFLDPRREATAAIAAPIHREAIASAGPIASELEARGAALATAGFDAQIPLRADCALTFFHPDGAEGDRFRLARDSDRSGGWRLAGREAGVESGTIEAALGRSPLSFSTSALLRPILQDTLLPTAAYVGGPAELSYFAQLGPLYEWFGLALPLVVPRARFRCLDAGTRRRLEAVGLDADDVGRPRAELASKLAAGRSGDGPGPGELARAVGDRILPLVDQVTAEAAAIDAADPNLGRAAARTRATVSRALQRLTDRAARVVAERDTVALARVARLEAALAPDGVPQERAYGWPSLAGRHGPSRLKQLVFERLEEAGPFATGLLDLRP
jgi:bacillithiol biosynthesis cysteine-adding enzyme BshC